MGEIQGSSGWNGSQQGVVLSVCLENLQESAHPGTVTMSLTYASLVGGVGRAASAGSRSGSAALRHLAELYQEWE